MSKNKDGKTATSAPDKLKRKKYEAELATLQAELVALQEWVKATGAKICIVFEGRDTAGKGGTIKRIVERVSPRVFRVVALPAPSAREKSQMYIQRYVPHLPAAGEVIIFDRSWYNRAGVERVMGFCTPDEVARFLATAPAFEKAMIDSGIILIKYWLEVSPDEQTRRLKSRIDDPPQDLEALEHGPGVLWPLVRLLPRPRRHVHHDRHHVGAVAHRPHRQQAARPAEHHQPPAQRDPVQTPIAEQHHTAETTEAGRLPGTKTFGPPHPDPVLIRVSTAPASALQPAADHPHRMIAPRTSGRIVAGSR
jgi:polyphosphate kinase 2